MCDWYWYVLLSTGGVRASNLVTSPTAGVLCLPGAITVLDRGFNEMRYGFKQMASKIALTAWPHWSVNGYGSVLVHSAQPLYYMAMVDTDTPIR